MVSSVRATLARGNPAEPLIRALSRVIISGRDVDAVSALAATAIVRLAQSAEE
jgi:hypothetical protein